MDFLKQQTEYESLSSRAVEILHLLAEGLSDREISERLILTINTVKWYNRQIYSILGVSSRTQAIARAHELQVLDNTDRMQSPPKPTALLTKHNLPADATPFIGRKYELADLTHRLNTTRLLTLVGSPGTGKTRLALRVAQSLASSFADGIYFIPLAPLSDPDLVVNAIANTLEVTETQGQSLIETLKRTLRDNYTLLILDNFEHLLPAAPQVSELLAAAPNLKVLATSREPLHLYGEQQYAVQPLGLPDVVDDLQALASCESTALFIQQARAVQSDFQLTPDNAAAVAQICVRLEGLPLAIELAAARIKLLTPQALLVRLDNRLNALTGSIRDLPPRQQTLRGTIDWSYNLLTDDEKLLFARLSVFRGGRSLEAVETICGPGLPIDPLDGVESLLHKNLLHQQEGEDGEPRFVMLETLQEYACECLESSSEATEIRRRHAEYFLVLAENAEPEMRSGRFHYWMAKLEVEHHNVLAALEWLLAQDDTELGLRLVSVLRDFWIMSDRFIEGVYWTEAALSKIETAQPSLRAKIYIASGYIGYYASRGEARIQARQRLYDAAHVAGTADEQGLRAWALILFGAYSIGEAEGYELALAAAQQGVGLFRELDDKEGLAQGLCIVGELARTHSDDSLALDVYEECLALVLVTGEMRRESMMLGNLGFIARHQNDTDRAERLFKASLHKALEHRYDKHIIINCLIPIAGVMATHGDVHSAVRLFGAVDCFLKAMGLGMQAGNQQEYDRELVYLQGLVDEATFEEAWSAGRTMTLEQAIALALG